MNSIVIGLGKMGLGFDLKSSRNDVFSHVKAYMLNRNFSLIAGIDPCAARRREFQAFTGLPSFFSIADFAKANPVPEIDIVSICTPSDQRIQIVADCISRISPRGIILEKPVALSTGEGKSIINLCRKESVGLSVNYFRRFLPGFQKMRNEILEDNKFGRLQSANVYYSKGLFNNGSHFINLLQFLIGGMPGIKWVSRPRRCPVLKKDFDINFVMEWNGIDVFFHSVDERFFSLGEMDLIFEKGRICLKDYFFSMSVYSAVADPVFRGYRKLEETDSCSSFIPMDYMSHVIEAVRKFIEGGSENPAEGKSSLATVSICEGAVAF